MADSQDKTEEATPKRKRDARKKGNVFSSRDVANLASMLILFAALRLLVPTIYGWLSQTFEHYTDLAASMDALTVTGVGEVFRYAVIVMGIGILPLALIATLVGVVSTGAQTRFLFSYESMKPKFERINPLQGIKRMFSLRSVVELVKNIIKITVILVVIYLYIKNQVVAFARMLDMGIEASTVYFLETLFTMCMEICIFFGVVAFADYLYQRWDYNKNLKMSKQEVKEEYKQTEGDPQIKSRIRDLQRRMASRRMMQQVPEADVIIRNPTHYAIAMKYNPEKDIAPRVLAKGADELAMRIVKVGEENHVFIQEDPELTRAIYAVADVGDYIPFEFYKAVADLLALVYRMEKAAL